MVMFGSHQLSIERLRTTALENTHELYMLIDDCWNHFCVPKDSGTLLGVQVHTVTLKYGRICLENKTVERGPAVLCFLSYAK